MAINFHAFTDGDAVASGVVRKLVLHGSRVTFRYSYSWLGVNVEGEFKSTVVAADHVKGEWKERSQDKIDGRKRWRGRAKFVMPEAGGRRTLVGVWGMKTGKMAERWIVDVGG